MTKMVESNLIRAKLITSMELSLPPVCSALLCCLILATLKNCSEKYYYSLKYYLHQDQDEGRGPWVTKYQGELNLESSGMKKFHEKLKLGP